MTPPSPQGSPEGAPEPRYLRAYYYEFKPTGDDAVDAVLEAVALAGKSYHHTGDWGDADQYGDMGYWTLIQQRADELAASRLSAPPAAPARDAILEEAAKQAEAAIDPEWPGDDMSVQCQNIASAIRSLKEKP